MSLSWLALPAFWAGLAFGAGLGVCAVYVLRGLVEYARDRRDARAPQLSVTYRPLSQEELGMTQSPRAAIEPRRTTTGKDGVRRE